MGPPFVMFSLRALLVLCTLLLQVSSQVIYADTTDDCTTEGPLLGNSVYCCSGACLDGTTIGNPGQCEYWLDLCGDVDSPPSCAYNQVLSYNDPSTVDSGDGCCGACCCECQYQRNNWTWSCCECPAGFIAVDVGTCDGSTSPSCVGCQEPDQILTGDPSTGFQCVTSSSSSSSLTTTSSTTITSDTPTTSDTLTNSATTSPSSTPTISQPTASDTSSPSNTGSQSTTQPDTSIVSQSTPTSESNTPTSSNTASPSSASSLPPTSASSQSVSASPSASGTSTVCNIADALSSAAAFLGLVSTGAGSLCPATDVKSVAINLLGLAYSKIVDDISPGDGLLGNDEAYAFGFFATAAVLFGLPEELGAAGVLGLAAAEFEELCTINTVLNFGLTTVGVALADFMNRDCPPAITKRYLALEASERDITEASWSLSPRTGAGGSSNPCAEFVGLFPTNYSLPKQGEKVCSEILSYNTADMGAYPELVNATTILQQFCNSGNLTVLVHWANFLSATNECIPICTIASNTITTTTTTNSTKANPNTMVSTLSSLPLVDIKIIYPMTTTTTTCLEGTQVEYSVPTPEGLKSHGTMPVNATSAGINSSTNISSSSPFTAGSGTAESESSGVAATSASSGSAVVSGTGILSTVPAQQTTSGGKILSDKSVIGLVLAGLGIIFNV